MDVNHFPQSPLQITTEPENTPRQQQDSPPSSVASISPVQSDPTFNLENVPPNIETAATRRYDPEAGTSRRSSDDPLLLRNSIKDPAHLTQLRRRGKQGKKISEFYERQNEHIKELLSEPGEVDAGEEARLLKLKIAIWGSFGANVLLFALQLTAAILSGSLALFATTADAFMDLMSSSVLVYTGRAALRQDFVRYPTGKKRMETAGIIVFATLMATLSIQLITEAVRALLSKHHEVDTDYVSIGCVVVALAVKLALYFYCIALKQYPTARIFAQDHRNDVVFNSMGLTFSIIGAKVLWWIDPAGALLIAVLILRSWGITAYEHIQYIIGKTADPAILQRLTYISMTHDPRILQVDTCRAYHAGEHFFVEVDIVLPPEMTVKESHDIAEALQIKLESLQNVERAFVHIDYETDHRPEHRRYSD
ncbi:hypothetical protein HK104_010665 [Borealophlyctis nickersoniae]|nr:hypothetical protein HK104_010665 [Borealophlyctis nickersoniae]